MRAVRVHAHGGPEELRLDEVPVPVPGVREVLIEVAASGVNFLDVHYREGRYASAIPFTLGCESAGVVAAVGRDVASVEVGDHVGQVFSLGAHADFQLIAESALIRLGTDVSTTVAAGTLMAGLTAQSLVRTVHPITGGETILVHAAAGGVGHLLVQAAQLAGARVIATVGSRSKADYVSDLGVEAVIRYDRDNFVQQVHEITDGVGVDVIYDAVGESTFLQGLDGLAPRGHMVLYGGASGRVRTLDPQVLMDKGSLALSRPRLWDFISKPAERQWRADELLTWLREGRVRPRLDQILPLSEAATAHRLMEERRTIGKLVLQSTLDAS